MSDPLDLSKHEKTILVGCEYSNTVAGAFRARGWHAVSCDLVPSEGPPEYHVIGDVRELLGLGWDMGIFHPPCTYLAVCGARWWEERLTWTEESKAIGLAVEQVEALELVCDLLNAPIARIAIENPVGLIGTRIRPANQFVQPYEFGPCDVEIDGEMVSTGTVKNTGLWTENLPDLIPTNIVSGRYARVHRMGPTTDPSVRRRERARFPTGIAAAMAAQWGEATRGYGQVPLAGLEWSGHRASIR